MKRASGLFAAALIVLAAAVSAGRVAAQPAAVTSENLNQMIAKAKAPADHEAIAAYYDGEAAANEKMVKLHRASENIYTKTTNVLHCKALIRSYQQAAEQDRALAAWHRAMARKGAGQ
ncbi:MAG TPA: hypothetical protein VFB33_16010 [Candidatus Binataceae bacterium]|jgi:hypothetical protein|nr:hypothetical protein [Candidatus Binataceae bacterium]